MKKKSRKSVFSGIFLILTFVSLFLRVLNFIFGKKRIEKIEDNLKKFEKEEITEIIKLAEGKETKQKYWHDSLGIFQSYFIPNHKNSHKPKILETKSLVTIAFMLGFLKLMILSYIFLISPFEAWMSEAIAGRVLELVNIERKNENIGLLTLNPVLSAAAQRKAEDMFERGYFSHFTPEGEKPWDFINREEYPYLFVGENLAMNFTGAESVHQALMNSPTHKKNIVNPKYNEIGLAMVSGEYEGKKTNILVQMFGARNQSGAELAKTDEVESPAKIESETLISQNEKDISAIPAVVKKEIVNEPEPVFKEVLEKKIEVISSEEQFSSEQQISELPDLIRAQVEETVESEISFSNSVLDSSEAIGVVKMPNSDIPHITFVSSITDSLGKIFLISLIIMIMALVLSILVRIRVQHKSAIIQTFVLLIFIAGLVYWRLDVQGLDLVEIFLL